MKALSIQLKDYIEYKLSTVGYKGITYPSYNTPSKYQAYNRVRKEIAKRLGEPVGNRAISIVEYYQYKELVDDIFNDSKKEEKQVRPMKADMINKAIWYATEKHDGQKRKGSNIPYIAHPFEVGMLLQSFPKSTTDVVASGILHDVVEDCGISIEEIRKEFNSNIAILVKGVTEDKSLVWEDRKSKTLLAISDMGKDQVLLLFADKFSNLRSMYNDYQTVEEDLWGRFGRGKDKQAWYYISLYYKFIEYNRSNFAIFPVRYLVEFHRYLEALFGKEEKWKINWNI